MPVYFTLQLGDDGSPEHPKEFCRLPPPSKKSGYILRFVIIAGSKASCSPILVTNYPAQGSLFARNQFQKIRFKTDGRSDAFCEICIETPGAYEYNIEYTDWELNAQVKSVVTGYFVVDPRLYLPNDSILDPTKTVGSASNSTILPLDGITILSVVPKWMPTLSGWPAFFDEFAEAGYNMVHFAPLNQRGISNSPYSIYDQLAFSEDLFDQKNLTEPEKEEIMKNMVKTIHSKNKILSITDIVWNHTACNSSWLLEHPEAGYNLKTAPHLRPAYELDDAILQFSDDIATVHGKSATVKNDQELVDIVHLFYAKNLLELNLWQFYVVDSATLFKQFREKWTCLKQNTLESSEFDPNLYQSTDFTRLSLEERDRVFYKDAFENPKTYQRFSKSIKLSIAMSFVYKLSADLGISNTDQQIDLFVKLVNNLNMPFYHECDEDLVCIKDQILNRARYLRIAEHGPKLGEITRYTPIVDTYFTRLPVNHITQNRHPDELCLASNGWIWNADPLINFAAEESKAYLRREVISWGDCVKLRYGNGPQDNEWLWQHQIAYTRKMASIFHGLRIDNCHSTPIHVAQHLLDIARSVNPDLYVFAELFTGSEEKDILFISKLGINSLIREAMNAWDPQEMSRTIHRQGGTPIGSFTIPAEYIPLEMLGHDMNSDFYESSCESTELAVELHGSKPHIMLMDCTHDNETPYQKRTAEDSLSNAALVTMSTCAVGSVKGYDEIVPELLNVVTESRKYRLPDSFEGIFPAKSILNILHTKMAREGYHEIHVNQEHDYISVHRVHPVTHDGYLLIARCAFRGNSGKSGPTHSPIILRNQSVHVLESATLTVQTGGHTGHSSSPYLHDSSVESDTEELIPPSTPTQLYHAFDGDSFDDILQQNSQKIKRKESRRVLGYISGLPSILEFSTVLSQITHSFVDSVGDNGDVQTVILIDGNHFEPGSIVLYRTWVVGTGIEQDTVVLPSPNREELAVAETMPTSGIVVKPDPLAETPDLSVVTLDLKSLALNLETPIEGTFERLWVHLGMNHPNTAIEIMVRFGYGVLGSSKLWFTSQNSNWAPDLYDAVNDLDARDLNTALFRVASEEEDVTGDSTYDVPGYGPLPYCGLQGIVSALVHIARGNDLHAELFDNLRRGKWLSDYVVNRLNKAVEAYPALEKLRNWLKTRLCLVNDISPSLIPKYFAIVIMLAYQGLKYRALTLGTGELSLRQMNSGHTSSLEHFGEGCLMTTYQLYGLVNSTSLFPKPYPLDIYGPEKMNWSNTQHTPSLAAGLTHFSTHHMRCWGRDIFISLRGLFLYPGHFSAARSHIIAFGSTLRHGLIPNLLDQGNRPRYNARDATWFWMSSVRDYCRLSPEGYDFLGVVVARRFIPIKRYTSGFGSTADQGPEREDADTFIEPSDPRTYQFTNTIAELCQEILERHARGIKFREWNAGPSLDHAMRSDGFEIEITTDWATDSPLRGFTRGGNQWNCGTWMDKMGDSEKAGIYGVPATPRDGSAVELVGLLKCILDWISTEVLIKGKQWWRWAGVMVPVDNTDSLIQYSVWNNLLLKSFEKVFYIPLNCNDDSKYHAVRSELVNRRGIYRDVVSATLPYTEYQLRPNICIAMAHAPELFDPDHARHALTVIKESLLGPLGIKTLDPKDWAYRGMYDNGNDSTDSTVAHGFNYHQGPEWLWVMGYFIRAYIQFFTVIPGHDPAMVEKELVWVQRQLLTHKRHLFNTQTNPFAGLPELTNQNGAYCSGSCVTQAWSTAVMLEVVQDLFALKH
ncbi:bifunctional 4-alpha-glucanotransferase/amylo-alpha-1,6-glucosidase [Batrachochytrium dendrobatidis]|nr:bifunctional 4-alpha-glucanotransferase/amylo-alpha-1,6-glucosidase [Batrachochytrium dendrobatidis]KAK5669236.1 bifunctional 4-alpha-glucanotransferase/amylo-alpha-1,6-glucosidase [Batrachochytrium dendrobatidis]